jgi:homoserine O-acetyltransferase/O-succinyltransferase
MVTNKVYHYNKKFELESGSYLPELQLFYTTYGKLNADKSNVIWICHAFSGNSDFTEWWPGLFGENKLYDPNKYFVVCVNMIGGCYGSTGPLSENPETGTPYFHDFPVITNKDIVNTYDIIRKLLHIDRIHTVIGCSMGGQQAMEWSVKEPKLFEYLIAIGANAKHSPWAVAFNETQRMAIAADQTWKENNENAGMEGMKAARAVGLLSYRNYVCYQAKQHETSDSVIDNFKASSYQNYQGEKMTKRFNAFSYWIISKAMDSQNVGRDRGGLEKALSRIKAKSLFLGIDNDILFPVVEQKFLAEHVPYGQYDEIDSIYGHDGFLLEFEKLTKAISSFYSETSRQKKSA